MKQSKELTEFYRAYLAWVEAGAVYSGGFSVRYGLCNNLAKYFHYSNYVLCCELADQFEEAGLEHTLPFNGDSHEYFYETNSGACHLNPKRIQWVRDHCKENM